MFILTNDDNFLKTLKEQIGKQVVIHYSCEECDDDQVTYEEEVTDEMIQQITNNQELMIGLPCTNCGTNTYSLKIPYIQGIELM